MWLAVVGWRPIGSQRPLPPPCARQVMIDPTRFMGVEAVKEAVQHLNSGRSVGKVGAEPAA